MDLGSDGYQISTVVVYTQDPLAGGGIAILDATGTVVVRQRFKRGVEEGVKDVYYFGYYFKFDNVAGRSVRLWWGKKQGSIRVSEVKVLGQLPDLELANITLLIQ